MPLKPILLFSTPYAVQCFIWLLIKFTPSWLVCVPITRYLPYMPVNSGSSAKQQTQASQQARAYQQSSRCLLTCLQASSSSYPTCRGIHNNADEQLLSKKPASLARGDSVVCGCCVTADRAGC